MTRSSSSSRQFTIPSEVRGMFGIKPLDEVEIIEVRPRQAREPWPMSRLRSGVLGDHYSCVVGAHIHT